MAGVPLFRAVGFRMGLPPGTALGLNAPGGGEPDVLGTISATLMITLAIGVIAAILIAASRRREATVSVEQALTAPTVICSLGAAVLHFWVAPELLATWAPAGIASFVLATVQLELGLAFTRPRLRRAALPAAFVVNALAVASWFWSHVAGPPVGPTAGRPGPVSGTELAIFCFQSALVALLGLALWPGTRDRLRIRRLDAGTAIEMRSLAASIVGLLTFLAMAGVGPGHS